MRYYATDDSEWMDAALGPLKRDVMEAHEVVQIRDGQIEALEARNRALQRRTDALVEVLEEIAHMHVEGHIVYAIERARAVLKETESPHRAAGA